MPNPSSRTPLLIIFLTVFIDLLGFGMVIPLLPIYATQFTVDESGWSIGLLMASFSAMQFLFAPLWGRLSDHVGRRPVLMLGLAGSMVFYTLFGVATLWGSFALLFLSRAAAGIFGATIPTAQAYIADVTTVEQRAGGMALFGAAFGLGFTFGPLLGAAALLGSGSAGLSPWPGYCAAALSGTAFLFAALRLPESLRHGSVRAAGHVFSAAALRQAIAVPSIALLLAASFICILSFSNLESTMSLLLKNETGAFRFEFHQVLLVFTYVGLVLSLAQGLVVRRLSKRVSENILAPCGMLVSIGGFVLLAWASGQGSLPLLLAAILVEVVGFAFMTPSLNALISRRSDPAAQGGIMGIAQSVSSLARIAGPIFGIRLFYESARLPFWAAAVLMTFALVLVVIAVRAGEDFPNGPPSAPRR